MGGLSISISKDDTIVSEMKYTAFGEIREMNGSSPTDFKAIPTRNRSYTRMRKEVEFMGISDRHITSQMHGPI